MQDDPFKELSGLLQENMSTNVDEAFKASWVCGELGTMTDGLALKLDRFKHIITDYILSDHLTLAEPNMTKTQVDGSHADPIGGTHSHQVITPKQLLPLHPGDRVIVIPANAGQDFVIIARVIARG